jgi:hypothetical protein
MGRANFGADAPTPTAIVREVSGQSLVVLGHVGLQLLATSRNYKECSLRSTWSVKTKPHGPRFPREGEERTWPHSLQLDSKMNSPPSPAVMSVRASLARRRYSSLPSSSSILVLLRSFQHPAGGPRRCRLRLRDPRAGTGQKQRWVAEEGYHHSSAPGIRLTHVILLDLLVGGILTQGLAHDPDYIIRCVQMVHATLICQNQRISILS